MELIIDVRVRYQRTTSKIGLDLKDELKRWEEIRRVDDYVVDKQVTFTITCEGGPVPASLAQALLSQVFDPEANFLERVTITDRHGSRLASRDYGAQRRESATELADRSGVTHYRRKGDPYIEVD